MKNSNFDLIGQDYYYPLGGFDLREDYDTFHKSLFKYFSSNSSTSQNLSNSFDDNQNEPDNVIAINLFTIWQSNKRIKN